MFNGKLKAITFSFDDGTIHDRRLVELFKRYHVKGTFHINSGIFGLEASAMVDGEAVDVTRLQAEEVVSLYRGHELAAHTLTHPPLINESDETVISQVERDRERLSFLCGYEVAGLAYPCGRPNSDARVERLVREYTNCQYARSIDFSGHFDLPTDLYHVCPSIYHTHYDKMMRMGREFLSLEPKTPKLFMIMGHSYELDVADRWDRLEEFLQLICGREDIFYGTMRQVLLDVD